MVHETGGTTYVYVHFIYLPIILAAGLFGMPGGLLAALYGGIVLGPLMPLDVIKGIPQEPANWLTRTGFLMLAGGLAGAMAERLRLQSRRDPMTRLPNRLQMCLDIDRRLSRKRARARPLFIVEIGLEHFTATITSLGHDFADLLHRAAAQRLQENLGGHAKLYDLSDGVFACVLDGVPPRAAARIGQRLMGALNDSFILKDVPVLTGGRMGVSCWPDHGADPAALLRAAASARAQTRRTGRRRALYDDSLDRDRRSRTSLLPDLQEALQSGTGLSLHYQPKIDLDSGNCTSVEALLRWEHPDRGMVPPGLFVPLVERTALIGPMTQYVLQAAVRQLQFWQTEGIDLRMAVNLSVRNLEEKGLPQRIVDMMRRNDINPAQLEVEVTETALMAAPDRINQALMTLRVQGVTVALDDFGTGHCSLGYLRDLPADTVKLDRSFLVRLDSDERSHVLVGATIETAHRLGFNVVGEGVEEETTLASLRELGCDTGQGYHFARPMPENLLLDWLASRKAKNCAPAHIVADGEPHAAAAKPEKR